MTPVFSLDFHADYRCGRSGACCTAGWPIPIELPAHALVEAAVADGRLRPPATAVGWLEQFPDAPVEYAGRLAHAPSGACIFYEAGTPNACALQARVGQGAMPLSCRQFPRILLADARGRFLSYSHYCPTAARQLFRPDASCTIVPVAHADRSWDALDATAELPPLLRPGVLMDLPAFDAFERALVACCARDDWSPEQALGAARALAERVRAWRPGRPSLLALIESERVRAMATPSRATEPPSSIAGWDACSRPLRRYLAAQAFGSWLAYQGRGVRTLVAGMADALKAVRAEASRLTADRGRPLDERLLVDAIRHVDLQRLHLEDRQALADRLSRVELDPPGLA